VATNPDFQGEQGAMDHGRRMVEEARAFKEAFANQAESFTKSIDLRGRVDRNPIGMIALAAGVGYVLGGGLFSPATGKLIKIGMRVALLPLLKTQLSNLAGMATESGGPAAGEGAAGPTF
jgi:hypothetical protein